MTINERFKKVVLYLVDSKIAKSKKEIAQNINIKPQNLTEILGNRIIVSAETIAYMCEYYNVSADWLLTGKGEMLRSSVVPINNTQNNNHSDNCTQNNYNNSDALRLMEKMVDVLKEEIETIKNK